MGKFGERILATDRVAGRQPANPSARARPARRPPASPPAPVACSAQLGAA